MCPCTVRMNKKGLGSTLLTPEEVPIWTDDYLVIDGKNGEEKVPWTLMKYIEYSHVKYPSKSKFFCVREGVLILWCTILCAVV